MAKTVNRDDPVATQVQCAQCRGEKFEKWHWDSPEAITAGVQITDERSAEEYGPDRRRIQVNDAIV